MMLKLLEQESEIKQAQRQLEKAIRHDFTGNQRRTIGYPGGRIPDAHVWTRGSFWYYTGSGGKKNPRYWNWFGQLKDQGNLHIAFEANVPLSGRNGQVNGFLARDDSTDVVYLMHSGGVGGGTKGVGKASFLAWLSQEPIEVRDSTGGSRWGIIVMPVTGRQATDSATRYIEKVAEYKAAAREGKLGTQSFQRRVQAVRDFQAEARGRRTGSRSSKIDYVSRHGEVVDALKDWREKRGLPTRAKIVNNILLDLGVARGKELTEAYEVKTATSRQSLYAALGQLLVHGHGRDCQRWIVLPDDREAPDDIVRALDDLGVAVIRYSINRNGVTIHDA